MKPLLTGYLIGQCANVVKSALWWTSFSPLIYALLRNQTDGVSRDSAIGAMRIAFNLSMLLLSPIAGALIDRSDVRRVLLWSTVGRGVIWGFLLPVSWYYFSTQVSVLYPLLVAFSFVDGTAVAFANVVDIDMGGLDLLSKQHGEEPTDSLRSFFNTVHSIVFDVSMVLFTPAMAFLSWYIADVLNDSSSVDFSTRDSTTGGMVLVFALTFLIMTLASLIAYGCNIPSETERKSQLHTPLVNADRLNDDSDENSGKQAAAVVSCCSLGSEICEGLSIMFSNPPIRWRILFVGLEVALEDAMVAVVIPEYALSEYDMCKGHDNCVLPLWFGPQHNNMENVTMIGNNSTSVDGAPICASIWTALLIACGKLAAVFAAFIFHKYWKTPTKPSGYRPLFILIFLSSISTLLFPWSRHLKQNNDPVNARIMVFSASFLFFLFSAPAKIGLETLLQGLAADLPGEIQGKIFGVIGTAVTSIDAIIILLMTIAFGHFKHACPIGSACEENGLTMALWFTCGIYCLHGLCEVILGTWLMVPSSLQKDEDSGSITAPTPGSVFASYMEEVPGRSSISSVNSNLNAAAGGYLQPPMSPKSPRLFGVRE
jgi:MFS family permease